MTPADVQKIAEAFLLWNGNHTWKVIDVAPTPDGAIGFSLATQDGSVIAKFTMDPHSGRIRRIADRRATDMSRQLISVWLQSVSSTAAARIRERFRLKRRLWTVLSRRRPR